MSERVSASKAGSSLPSDGGPVVRVFPSRRTIRRLVNRVRIAATWVVIAGVSVAGVPAEVLAAPFYWDSDASASGNNASTGAGLGGSGLWDTTTANWWDGVSVTNDNVWNNAGIDTAIFTGTGGTVSLGAAIVAGELDFNQAGYTVADPSGFGLTLGGSAPTISVSSGVAAVVSAQLHGTNGLIIDGAGTLTLGNAANDYTGDTVLRGGSLRAWNDSNLGATTGNVVFDGGTLQIAGFASNRTFNVSSSGTIDVSRNFTAMLPGAITGSGSLTKTGWGELRFLNNNTGFTGNLTVNSGVTRVFSYQGVPQVSYTGALNAANSYTINSGGDFIADASGVTTSISPDLLSDTATISLRGGRIQFASNNLNSGDFAFTETAGVVNLDSGASTINVAHTATNSASVFDLGALNQNSVGTTINFTNSGATGTLGLSGDNPRITFRTEPTLNDGIIGGWAVVNTNDFASYISGQGVGALSTSGFLGYSSTDLTTAGATDNVIVTNTPSAAITSRTVNSLKWNALTNSTMMIASGNTLNIDSGGLLAVGN
ncbi:MAG TPA: autotransporter-associated beta strand repeat-containing protein, partial [Pirellulales bacterium]|nr:autotransporter-associated beta strand repeat-containing protein [Pirellulales bacterium]